ncbi:MAG: glycosyltransferase [Pseudomonadota bacterium]
MRRSGQTMPHPKQGYTRAQDALVSIESRLRRLPQRSGAAQSTVTHLVPNEVLADYERAAIARALPQQAAPPPKPAPKAEVPLLLTRDLMPAPRRPASPALDAPQAPAKQRRGPRLGERLVSAGALSEEDLVQALTLQRQEETRLGEILIGRRMVTEEALSNALSAQWGACPIDLEDVVPDPRLVAEIGADYCLATGTVPLARKGGATVVASARPDAFARLRDTLEERLGPVLMVLAPDQQVANAVARAVPKELARRAEERTPTPLSCRNWKQGTAALVISLTLGTLLAATLLAPIETLFAMTLFGMATLLATSTLKGLALGQIIRQWLRGGRRVPAELPAPHTKLPVISMLVPLLGEADVASALIQRLLRLRYPRELTDVIVLVEQHDWTTRRALAETHVPSFMRIVIVPPGTVRTKPRALNYGLSFARGGIVGIWDAEDAPHPDQLHTVAACFARADPRVACLQGALDFYNARTNWLSRCFTLEYATWFRAFLPGLQRLGLPIPLGGTTLFFRKQALEVLGGWDAHNVTEDADLGIRLYRAGYRTEIVDTVTREEANCRLLPWIRQRSRWLKGYAMTYAVHMRRPFRLWREMGTAGFIGFQALFLGTLSQFLLAPVLISLWFLAVLDWHPLVGHIPMTLGWAFLALVIVSEAISVGLTLSANWRTERAGLLWWLPVLHLYFPLASLAGYKGVWEMLSRPFHWHKTEHGLHGEDGVYA